MMKTGQGQKPRFSILWKLSGAALTLLLLSFAVYLSRSHVNPPQVRLTSDAPSLENPSALYSWSYLSDGVYFGVEDQAMKVACKAHGVWQVHSEKSRLRIESFRCNDQDLTPEGDYTFQAAEMLALDPKATAAASPINALTLALLREVNLGVKSLPSDRDSWTYDEERLGSSLTRKVIVTERNPRLKWSKNVEALIPSPSGIVHRIRSESSGISRGDPNPSHSFSPFEVLEELHMKETEMISRAAQKVSSVHVALEIKRISASPSALTSSSPIASLPLALQQSDPENNRRQILDLWNTFLAHPGDVKSANDPLYIRLKLAFRHDPRFAEEFRHKLEGFAADSEEFKLLLGALAYAGSDEATNVLIESATSKVSDPGWQRAIAPVLGLTQKPTEASWNYLENLYRTSQDPEIQKVAELALASAYGKGLKSEASEAFVDSIRKLDANRPENVRAILDLVGNAGLEAELPRLRAWAKSPDPDLRSAVAEALRLMKSSESEELLLQLLSDTAIEVERSAAHAFETRTLSSEALPSVLTALARSRDELLSVSLLETVYAARTLDPELSSKLKALRGKVSLSPSLAQRWAELEESLSVSSH